MKRIVLAKVLPAAAVLVLGLFIASRLAASRPMPEVMQKETKGTLVQVMEAQPQRQRLQVDVMGTVIPARELIVAPEVSGRIVELNPNLAPGGYLEAGEVIAQIDPRDYEATVNQAIGQLEHAKLNLELEHGRQVVAKREWEAVYPTTRSFEASSDLALRKPHLESAEADVAAAKSALDQARLNLERTTIRAPFNAIVKSESLEVGQLVTPQTTIATLAGTDTYWVQVSVPVSQLPWIELPDEEGRGGASAKILQQTGTDGGVKRQGRVTRLLGDLDPDGRMARVLVAVDDPLCLKDEHNNKQIPLLIGAYVRVEIEGEELDDICVIPRTAIREGDRIWIVDEDSRLSVHEVNIIWRNKGNVLVADHMEPGARIITSRIPTPIPGMLLRVEKSGDRKPPSRQSKAVTETGPLQVGGE